MAAAVRADADANVDATGSSGIVALPAAGIVVSTRVTFPGTAAEAAAVVEVGSEVEATAGAAAIAEAEAEAAASRVDAVDAAGARAAVAAVVGVAVAVIPRVEAEAEAEAAAAVVVAVPKRNVTSSTVGSISGLLRRRQEKLKKKNQRIFVKRSHNSMQSPLLVRATKRKKQKRKPLMGTPTWTRQLSLLTTLLPNLLRRNDVPPQNLMNHFEIFVSKIKVTLSSHVVIYRTT